MAIAENGNGICITIFLFFYFFKILSGKFENDSIPCLTGRLIGQQSHKKHLVNVQVGGGTAATTFHKDNFKKVPQNRLWHSDKAILENDDTILRNW